MQKFLIIQTAFIGDVILATPLIEKLHRRFPDARIDFLLRKGNEVLLSNHPYISKVYVWNKKENKYSNLFSILKEVRKESYDHLINLQRFFSTGLFTVFSGARRKTGFLKNPLSFCFHKRKVHRIEKGIHEIDRNISLIQHLTDSSFQRPVLYPSESHRNTIRKYQEVPYVCLAPASVWFTKQLPVEKWVELSSSLQKGYRIMFLGGAEDFNLCSSIAETAKTDNYENLCGKINLLESAALMKEAGMNYVNDSAPLHLASAVNANTTVFFCSTLPDFGFGPVSENASIAEIDYNLKCRPCGLHGRKSCPESHFRCGYDIQVNKYLI